MSLSLLKNYVIYFTVLIFSFFIVSCSSLEKENVNNDLLNVRGYLYITEDNSSFLDCDGKTEYLITNNIETNIAQIYKEISPSDLTPRYVEMKIRVLELYDKDFFDGYSGVIEIKELYHLAYESNGCKNEKDYNYRLSGNEPFWNIVIDENRGVVMKLMNEQEIFAEYQKPVFNNNEIEYNLYSGSQKMLIKIRKVDTFDTMSGSYYAHSVYVNFAGKSYYGNALQGRPLF
jgi:uncharacterized membrane protein